MHDALTYSSVVLALIALAVAAVSDWRRREASDLCWIVLMAAGVMAFSVRIFECGLPAYAYLMPLSMVLMCVDLVWDREGGPKSDVLIYSGILITAAVPTALLWDNEISGTFLSVPVIYLAMNLLYYTGIVKGGADAKAVIALAFLFPVYPDTGLIPFFVDVPDGQLPRVAVPAFSVFFMSTVLTMLTVPFYAILNVIRKDAETPFMFCGFRMDLEKAKDSYVWPLEDVLNGERTRSISGTDDPEAFDRLSSAGADRIWVTPIIPFLIPIAVSAAIVILLGNPLFLFI